MSVSTNTSRRTRRQELAQCHVQRFAVLSDLDHHKATIEEREDYEPHIRRGLVVWAGVDYQAIAEQAQKEAAVIIWDGGNNDFSFLKSDLEIVVVDPLRPVARVEDADVGQRLARGVDHNSLHRAVGGGDGDLAEVVQAARRGLDRGRSVSFAVLD